MCGLQIINKKSLHFITEYMLVASPGNSLYRNDDLLATIARLQDKHIYVYNLTVMPIHKQVVAT